MPPIVWQVTALALLALGTLCLLVKVVRRTRLRDASHAGFCPGPRRNRLLRLDPRWWFIVRHACGYELTGMTPDADGRVRCPECGSEVASRRAVRTRARWRPAWTGVALLVAGVGAGLGPGIQSGDWVKMIPTRALVATENARWTQTKPLRDELERRVWDGAVTGRSGEALARALGADLADDDIEDNAGRALTLLEQLGPDAIFPMRELLRSTDQQQRRYAAHTLRLAGVPPTPELLQLALEELVWDQPGMRRYGFWSARNYLRKNAHEADPWLAWGLGEGDQRQRFECATIVVDEKITALYEPAIPALVRSLADNHITDDAGMAGWKLSQLGELAIAGLERVLDSDDWQQRRKAAGTLWSIIDDLERDGREVRPSPALLRASVDLLRPPPKGSGVWSYTSGAADHLIRHADRAAPLLADAIRSDSRRQRVLAAGIAGFGGLDDLAPVAAPLLIPHLRDNSISGDAKWAMPALAGFGMSAVPLLEAYADDPDEQLAAAARHLIARARGQRPPSPPRLTGTTHDPASARPDGAAAYWWVSALDENEADPTRE